LSKDTHTVLHPDKAGLTTAFAFDLNQTVKALADHAIRQAGRTADGRGAEMGHAKPQQAGGNRFMRMGGNGLPVQK